MTALKPAYEAKSATSSIGTARAPLRSDRPPAIEKTGVKLYPDEVVIKGFLWNQTICIRGHDFLETPEGERVYENRFVLWGRIAWGLLREYETYEDTQKLGALEEHLAREGQSSG